MNKKIQLMLAFSGALALLFGLSVYFGLPVAITKAFLLLALMIFFYFNQEPDVLAVYGAFGLIFLGMAGLVGGHDSTGQYYTIWGIEWFIYFIIYLLFWLFCSWLRRLKDISNLHEMVIAGTTAGLWKWRDVSKDEQWWSPRFYKMLGYEEKEIPATLNNWNELIHPDDRASTSAALSEYIAGIRPSLEFEYRLRTKSGAYQWFLGSGEVQFKKDTRQPLRVVGSIVNIEHKKQYELALAHQAAILELSPNAIIMTDLDFVIRSWNKGAEKLYDIPAEQAIGTSIRSLLSTTYLYTTEEEVIEHFAAHGSWSGELHQVTPTGKKIYVLSSVMSMTGIDGMPAVVIVNSDIGLLRINKELSTALKMLENSTQYLEQLANVSSNDLKSPIITLQGLMNHLYTARAIAPGHEATVEMIRGLIEQMKSTSISLSSILQLRKNLISREFASENVSVSQVVRDVLEMLKANIAATEAQINVNVERGIIVRIPHTFLKTIIFNLVSNAIKFRYPGRTPVISIDADLTRSSLRIVVTDNGSGINLQRYQNKLFTIFARFHDGVEGNGIGLHSVKMIVDFYRGDISIDSEDKKGTKITIKIPIEPDDQD